MVKVRKLASRALLRILVILLTLGTASCGRFGEGSSASILIIDDLLGASGAQADSFSHVLSSDVVTLVEQDIGGQKVRVPTVFEDPGSVLIRIALKDRNPLFPSNVLNGVTITRYRVVYRRADGRNTPGVDVPYPFDGAITFTANANGTRAGLTLVRGQAKLEAPLRALRGQGGALFISTIAEVTFYGRDQGGADASVAGTISINFADWGDPVGGG